ncbi:B12-binding domain-containing radical SAM protein [Streptomyces sp. H39-C1]|uniref:B12-binding domain-containing radical SAM protein n=1 Tax=Streptomyces sp. H39-C1 TaxID=3004355 RepID=UPI0022B01AEE|nr:radical SAM protein [Streptomyces sp. H39-C1]MCZ4096099.1 radical SAM protein [Streptomyces sp. H39-C1]
MSLDTGTRLREILRLAGSPDEQHRLAEQDIHGLSIAPEALRSALASCHTGRVHVTGTLERRLVLLERADRQWVVADLSGQPHETRVWPAWLEGHLHLADAGSWLSLADLDEHAVGRFSRPRVLLAALYHPEYFPLPRFPLGISDVARAARSTLLGTVSLADMQLGVTLEDLITRVRVEAPDILGVSATFGQHDLLVKLLDTVFALPGPPVIVVGGSLTARNEGLLLERYPDLLVARAGGEATIEGLLGHWHGDLERKHIPALGYNGTARGGGIAIARRRTAKPIARDATADIFPELDLLPATFEHHGVAQLEASRGCTNFCSFCPRGHKGTWSGAAPDRLPWMLGELRKVYDRYPEVSRTLYLVDEEFIGRGDDAVSRALDVGRVLHEAGFAWESSCRVDQVVRTDRGTAWHVERADMWRTLVNRGLRRMLFGVESGVDSILTRFNKETGSEQNALAIRTLSALGVPTRFTYITFDHLMTLEELKATYAFQGRTDLLLDPQPHLAPEDIVRGVRDDAFVAQAATGRPLHTGISYMLVSMECLIGAAYTRKAQERGLTGSVRPSMGRVDARFADWRIGVASTWAQRWVDRNFALDYTLKSLEKILDGDQRDAVRAARVVLKDAAFTVLGEMIAVIETHPVIPVEEHAEQQLTVLIGTLLEARIDRLRERMASTVEQVGARLRGEHAKMLRHEHGRWESATGWQLINASDPCGT